MNRDLSILKVYGRPLQTTNLAATNSGGQLEQKNAANRSCCTDVTKVWISSGLHTFLRVRGSLGGLTLLAGLLWTYFQACGQMGTGNVVGDGRDAGDRAVRFGPWRISTRKTKRARRFAKRKLGPTRPGRNASDSTSIRGIVSDRARRLAAVDEWEQGRMAEIHAEDERRRHEHR